MATKNNSFVENIRAKVASDPMWAERAIIALFKYQTDHEQIAQQTEEHNGVGFTGVDAPILSSFAQQLERRSTYHLSSKQLAIAYKKLPKYAAQLARIAEEGTTKVSDKVVAAAVAQREAAHQPAAPAPVQVQVQVQVQEQPEFEFYYTPRPMPMGEPKYNFHVVGNRLVVYNRANVKLVTIVYPTSEDCELGYSLAVKGQYLPGFDNLMLSYMAGMDQFGDYMVKANPWL